MAASIYQTKPPGYFANARHDIVAALGTDAASWVLELGCGAGGTGRAVLAASKAGRYVGIELNPRAADDAANHLHQVLVGDVQEMDLTGLAGQFDALIISEVLEHLTDPWSTLERLAACLKPGGMVFASSPNVANWHVIRDLVLGRFRYGEAGIMDRTHLRWFTPETFRAMFEGAGLEVRSLRPMSPPRPKQRIVNALTRGRFAHLFMGQMMVVARRAPDMTSADRRPPRPVG